MIKQLLVVDDDAALCRSIQLQLNTRGIHTDIAHTAADGLARLREKTPDLALLDINLPDQDGFKALEQIVSLPASPPVVMLTVYLLYNDLYKSDCRLSMLLTGYSDSNK